jgi:hypothetical protein
MSSVTYSSSHRQTGTPVINIRSKFRTAPDLCKNILLAVLLGSASNSYKLYMQSHICIHKHIVHSIETLVGQKVQQIMGQQ